MQSLSSLEQLPAEIHLRIASYLTTEDAKSLARTCRSLQGAAEALVYRSIHICLPLSWEPDEETYNATPGARAHMNGDPNAPPFDQIVTRCRNDRLLYLVDGVLAALQSARGGSRAGWVKELVLELALEAEVTCKQHDVIDLVRYHLNSLTILPAVMDGQATGRSWILSLMPGPGPFTRLQRLKYDQPTDESCQSAFYHISRWTRNIRHLTITFSTFTFPTFDREKGSQDQSYPGYPQLRSLALEQVEAEHMPCVGEWVKKCTLLESLSIKCAEESEGFFEMDEDDLEAENPLVGLKKLREHNGLKRLEWIAGWPARSGVEKLCEEGFEHIELLVQSEAVQSESETYIENIHIPPLPNLKAILIPCRDTKWYRHLFAPDWAKAPPPRNAIGSHTLKALRSGRSLLAVQFGLSPSATADPIPLEEIIDPLQWLLTRSNGVLVRSYYNPRSGEEMWHLRRMERLIVDPKAYADPQHLASSHRGDDRKARAATSEAEYRWVDHTSYDGLPVPAEILKKMYRASHHARDVEWEQPGRDLGLSDEAWEVLRKWRKKLPRGDEQRPVTRRMTEAARATS